MGGRVAVRDSEAGAGRSVGALAIRGVTKRFGQVLAVDDVSLELPAGSFISLLGPSGCGKTTLLRIVAGFELPDSGSVLVDGVEITDMPAERRPFNMVFQRYALFPHLSVFDNVAYGLRTDLRRRLPVDEVTRRVTEMLDMVGLTGFERRWPGELSGGQAQRVAVARALVRRPTVLLLDEPLAALDRNVRHQVREELLRMHSELGTTFLFVTHDQDEALSISSLVGLMNCGRLEQLGTPESIYHNPASLFAAGFVGAGSLFEATATARRGNLVEVDVCGFRFAAVDSSAADSPAVTVLLRPQDLRAVPEGTGRISGTVATCAFLGSYYEIVVRTPLGILRLHERRPAVASSRLGVDWSDTAGIAYSSGGTPTTSGSGDGASPDPRVRKDGAPEA